MLVTSGSPTVLIRAGMAEWREATAVDATYAVHRPNLFGQCGETDLDSNTRRRSTCFALLLAASRNKGGISGCRYR